MKPSRRKFLLILLLQLVSLGAASYAWLLAGLPPLENLSQNLNPPSVRITDRNGRILYEILGEEIGRHGVVPLETIPLALRQATIATEDKNFYSNPGVDPVGILRALWINVRRSFQQHPIETLAGGSTITQQVARNLLLSPEERYQRSLYRKLREALLAWQLTLHFSKDEILALYLNQTYYGGLTYGVEAASQTFFGKPVSQLDLAESALLAGLPQAPSLYNPFTDPDAAKERQRVVLGLMQKTGFIDDEQRTLAEREKLVFASTPYPILAPHFVMMVRAQLDSMYTTAEVYQHGGLVVRTTLDLDWQGHAERAVDRQLAELHRREGGMGHNVNNAALVALDPYTSQILALVGSPDYFDETSGGAINMAIAPRQPGSALKPILYAAAVDPSGSLQNSPHTAPWTAATMLLDVSTSFLTHDGQAYTPANYDLQEHGPVLVRQALASSLNIPAVITLDHVGMQGLFEQATKLGITTLDDPEQYDLSLALGGGAVRLLELTAAYAAFANGGYRVDPVSILEVSDLQGNVLYAAPSASSKRVLDERVAWLISDILSDNDARQLGFGPYSTLRIDRPAAVKTGTTSNFHDNWTVGYTPDLAVGVWVGNTNYEPMREVNGLTGAAPIWHQFIRTVLTGRPPQPFVRPQGLVQEEVCSLSGLLPTPACPYLRWEWFIEGTQPTQPDHFYRQVQLDTATNSLADASTPPERVSYRTVLDLPPEAQTWARAEGLILMSDLLATSGVGTSPNSSAPLRLVSPTYGSVYRVSASVDPDAQRIRVEAVGEAGLGQVTLWMDGNLLGSFDQGPFRIWWPLAVGRHEAWAEGLILDGEWVISERVVFLVEQ
ncbi:MAG: transglycosylase domain-containing protein [Anaerolineales bacterium]